MYCVTSRSEIPSLLVNYCKSGLITLKQGDFFFVPHLLLHAKQGLTKKGGVWETSVSVSVTIYNKWPIIVFRVTSRSKCIHSYRDAVLVNGCKF